MGNTQQSQHKEKNLERKRSVPVFGATNSPRYLKKYSYTSEYGSEDITCTSMNSSKDDTEIIWSSSKLTTERLLVRICDMNPAVVANTRSILLLNNLLDQLPSALFVFKNLGVVDVEKNFISSLPNGLAQELPKLEFLRVSSNLLASFEPITDMGSNLRHLDLSKNSISAIPVSIKRLTGLKTLIVSRNKIRELPLELFDVDTLESLNVSYNDIAVVERGIGKLKNLRSLHLNSNPVSFIGPDIKNLKELAVLKLGDTSLPDELKRNCVSDRLECQVSTSWVCLFSTSQYVCLDAFIRDRRLLWSNEGSSSCSLCYLGLQTI